MFVVPFILRNELSSLYAWKLRPVLLFLENHGKHICSTDNPDEWLQENGFCVKKSWVYDSIVYAEIDEEKMSMKDFYSFEQLTTIQKRGTEECWRTFYIMESPPNEKNSEWAWNSLFEESISKVLHTIQDITTEL